MNLPKNLPFTYCTFTMHLQARDQLDLPPYKGSTLRGGFGHVFKRVCCIAPESQCRDACQHGKTCAYGHIFETPQPANAEGPIQAANLPHPFVLLPPLTTRERFEPGDSFEMGVTLVGHSIDFIPYFVYGFEELGRIGIGRGNGRYRLTHVTDSSGATVYDSTTKAFASDYKRDKFEDLYSAMTQSTHLTLDFQTPTRILHHNRTTKELTFELLIRNLLRRASLLAEIHCGQKWQLDYRQVIEAARQDAHVEHSALDWYRWQRYSSRQNQRMNFDGFVGRITFAGNLTKYLPLIRLGSAIHIGKNTTFGMGKYVIINDHS